VVALVEDLMVSNVYTEATEFFRIGLIDLPPPKQVLIIHLDWYIRIIVTSRLEVLVPAIINIYIFSYVLL
jgi:hypothetical protein